MRLTVRRGVLVLAGLVSLAGLARSPARADVDGDDFVSGKPWHIRISTPANWRMSEQKSYSSACLRAAGLADSTNRECTRSSERASLASVLMWMHRRSPQGKMLLAAEQLAQPMSSYEYAHKTSELLARLGFVVRTPQLHAATGAYWIELENRRAFLRQAVLVSDRIGYSLTLAAPDARTRASHLRAFDYALRSIRIDRSQTDLTATPAASAPNPGGAGAPPAPPQRDADARETAP